MKDENNGASWLNSLGLERKYMFYMLKYMFYVYKERRTKIKGVKNNVVARSSLFCYKIFPPHFTLRITLYLWFLNCIEKFLLFVFSLLSSLSLEFSIGGKIIIVRIVQFCIINQRFNL